MSPTLHVIDLQISHNPFKIVFEPVGTLVPETGGVPEHPVKVASEHGLASIAVHIVLFRYAERTVPDSLLFSAGASCPGHSRIEHHFIIAGGRHEKAACNQYGIYDYLQHNADTLFLTFHTGTVGHKDFIKTGRASE